MILVDLSNSGVLLMCGYGCIKLHGEETERPPAAVVSNEQCNCRRIVCTYEVIVK